MREEIQAEARSLYSFRWQEFWVVTFFPVKSNDEQIIFWADTSKNLQDTLSSSWSRLLRGTYSPLEKGCAGFKIPDDSSD